MLILNKINFSTAVYLVQGPDAFAYLQGQFSQELKSPIGSAVYGLWLNEKGRILADSFVLRIARDAFMVINWSTRDTANFGSLIQRNIIADDVEVIDESAEWVGMLLIGAGAEAALANVCNGQLAPGNFLESNGALVFAGPKAAMEIFFLLLPAQTASAWPARLQAAGAIAVDPETMRRERMFAGLVEIPTELGPGDLPHEGGLGDSAVSYTKGCYLGQEVTNRIKTMGQVRRRLHVVRGTGVPPALPAEVFQSGKRVGELRSSVSEGTGFVGVAMLTLLALDPSRGLAFAADGAPSVQVVRAL